MKVEKRIFDHTTDGRSVDLIRIETSSKIAIEIITYGATLKTVDMPDKNGKVENVNLSFDTLAEYIDKNTYFGASVGRFANRIGGSSFVLDGKTYPLIANQGEHQLHGGPDGFSHRLWDYNIIESKDSISVEFTLVSPDGDQGFPGTLKASVIYSLNEENQLTIEYKAVTDKTTVVNFTNHAYWNLKGAGNGDVFDHVLRINSSEILEYGEGAIPTGAKTNIRGTGFDFREPVTLKSNFEKNPEGWDHCYVISNGDGIFRDIAELYHPESGRGLRIETDQPSVQFYSATWMESMKGSQGKQYEAYGAACLETQNYPDAPNHPDFPSAELKAGEQFYSKTVHHLYVK